MHYSEVFVGGGGGGVSRALHDTNTSCSEDTCK